MLTDFQRVCERRIAEVVFLPLSNRTIHDDGEGGAMVEARLGPAKVWIYAVAADGAQWHLGTDHGYFEGWDYETPGLLIEAFVSDLDVIARTGAAPPRRNPGSL